MYKFWIGVYLLKNFKTNTYNHAEISKFSDKFSTQNFHSKIDEFVKDKIK